MARRSALLWTDMIYVVNYASDRFVESQQMQNARWASLYAGRDLTVCSFSKGDVLPALRSLSLVNEADILRVLLESRGDGLWAWKAILSCHVYRHVANEGDIVFYMDSGACPIGSFDSIWQHIRTHGHFFVRVSAFEEVPKVQRWLRSIPAMAVKAHLFEELDFSSRLWTKTFNPLPGNDYGLPASVIDRLVGDRMSVSEASRQLLDMEQVCGGFQGYLKRATDDPILSDMLANTSPTFFDDVVRTEIVRPYIDHRHDQSMLSLIVNAESIKRPQFSKCIVEEFGEACLHRGYESEFPKPV